MLTRVDGTTYALSFFHMAQENFSVRVNENWKKENARFSLYTFLGDETTWYSLEKVSEDIYRVTLPSKGETVLVNPYSFESRPLIHLNGNGTGTLTIDNENGRHEWTFNDIDEFIEIDSEKMCFYKDNTLKNDTVTGTSAVCPA